MTAIALSVKKHISSTQNTTQRKCELLLATAIIARSTSVIFSKMALGSFGPFNLLALRFIAAFILLSLIFAKKIIHIRRKEILYGMILGVLYTGLLTTELFGLRMTDSGTTSFIENSAMIFVPLLQLILFRKKPAGTDYIRLTLAVGGIAVLTLGGTGGLFRGGSLMLIGTALLYASIIIATARFAKECDPLLLGIAEIGTVGVLSLILSIIFESPRLPQTGMEWLMLLALAGICSGVGFTLQPIALRGTTAERAGMMCAISPMSAATLGIIFLQEDFTANKAIGCALILLSLMAEPLIKALRRAAHHAGAKASL